MKKLNENDFVMINEEIAFCINATKYNDFNVKPGMIILDKDLAISSMMNVNSFEALEDDIPINETKKDIIISYITTWGEFATWVFINNEWVKTATRFINENENEKLKKDIETLCGNGDEICYIRSVRYDDDDLYGGDSFREIYNKSGEYFDYKDYIKTSIHGLYANVYANVCANKITGYEWITKEHIGNIISNRGIKTIDVILPKDDILSKVIEETIRRDNEIVLFFDENCNRYFESSRKDIEISKNMVNHYLRTVKQTTIITAFNIIYSKLGCELITVHDNDDIVITRFTNGLFRIEYKEGSTLDGKPCNIVKFY